MKDSGLAVQASALAKVQVTVQVSALAKARVSVLASVQATEMALKPGVQL